MAEAVGTFLAALSIDEAEIAARFMVGRALEQGEEKRLQISGRAIWKIVAQMVGAQDQGEDIFAGAEDFGEAVAIMLRHRTTDPEPTLTIGEVDSALHDIAEIEGRHARNRKLDALRALFERSSALEGKYLAKVLIREMRHGVSEGMMLEAIARMANRPVVDVRRIHMLEADLGRTVRILREGGAVRTGPGRIAAGVKPLKPMLAQPAADIAEAFAMLGPELAFEHKLDGARVQIHRGEDCTRIFSRRMNEITASLPEVVDRIGKLGGRSAILDGEVIAVDPLGRPLAFQELMRRFGRVKDIERLRAEQPIRLHLFDLLALDSTLVIDHPYGVVAKALKSAYMPGVRGRGWVKIKHARTLDLVILAADWGYGRRHGWLSNYHLAARNEQTGGFSEVGKTFKGLTDEQFRAMTERLLALKISESHGTIVVRPEVVVEVGYNDIQRSPQYEAGMALRFARIVRIRPDKAASEADTIEAVERDFERQLVKPLAAKV